MMPRIIRIAVLLTLVAAGDVAAQSARIRGFVTDLADGEPLVGVNVALRRDTVLVSGTATRDDGFYLIPDLEPGAYVLTVSYIGYRSQVDTLRILSGETRLLNLALVPADEELEEILIESEREAGAARPRAGQISVRTADVARIPSPSISGDLANYLSALPGVVTVGDRGGQLFIRGGEPWQNRVNLDGMEVFQPFHVLGFFSSFPAEILSQVEIYAGGFGSRFGGHLSSVIDVSARNGSKKAYSGSVTLSPFVSGGLAEGPLIGDRTSFIVSFRESVIAEGAAHLVDEPLPYRFGDLFAKVHAIVSEQGQLSLMMLRTHDRGTIGTAVIGPQRRGLQARPPDDVRWTNEAYGARYVVLPRSFPVFAEFLVSYSRLRTELGNPDRPDRTGRVASANTSVNVTHFARSLEIAWGAFARTLEMQSELSGQFQAFALDQEWLTEVGAYIEPAWRPNDELELRGGVRVHSFPSKSRTFIEPRARVLWTLGPGVWSGAFGVYHQEVVGLNDRRDAASVFTVWAATPYRRVPRAVHLIGGYSRELFRGFQVATEVYRKWLSDLFVPEWTAFPRFTTRLQPADGSVWGADVRMEYRRGRFSGSVTYGLSSVRYEARQQTLELWFGSPRLSYRPGHDRRHQIDVIVGYDSELADLNVRWQFGSGLPYSRALGFDGFVLMDGPVDVFDEEGSRRVVYERPFNGELPTYHRLDVTLSRTERVGPGSLKFQIGLINTYDRRNLFYLDTFTLTRADQLPVIPTFGLQYVFGE